MSIVSIVSRRPLSACIRPLKHAVLGLALAGGLGLAAGQKNDLCFSKGDVDLALRTLKAAPQQGFAPGQFDEAGIDQSLRA